MKKRYVAVSLVSLLLGFYLGNSVVEKQVKPQDLVKELQLLLKTDEASEKACESCEDSDWGEAEIPAEDASPDQGETVFDLDAGSTGD